MNGRVFGCGHVFYKKEPRAHDRVGGGENRYSCCLSGCGQVLPAEVQVGTCRTFATLSAWMATLSGERELADRCTAVAFVVRDQRTILGVAVGSSSPGILHEDRIERFPCHRHGSNMCRSTGHDHLLEMKGTEKKALPAGSAFPG